MGASLSSKSKHLSEKDAERLEEITYFTKREIQKWHAHFMKDCPSGKLNKEEFQTIYKQVFSGGDPSKFAGFVFNVFDKDLDGSITFNEFIMALSVTSRGNLDEKLTWAFSLYDIDRDGHISRPEMIKIVSAIYEMIGDGNAINGGVSAEDKANQIFDHMDYNKDGLLTLEEFRGGAKSDPWIVHALAMDASHLQHAGTTT